MLDLIEVEPYAGLSTQLAYATRENISGDFVYTSDARLAMRPDTAECLHKAVKAAQAAGFSILVYDAYRPQAAQQLLWEAVANPDYVADPSRGSNHTRGAAVDVTLLDKDGKALDMGTGFDAMCAQSHHNRDDLPAAIERNRCLLLGIMLKAGFTWIPFEWWHYELPQAGHLDLIPSHPFVRAVTE